MLLKSTFLKVKGYRANKNRGITLIELLITMALIALFTLVVASIFRIGMQSFCVAEQQIESYSSGRLAYLNLERQIKSSEKIFIKDHKIYMQDLETPDQYYNYYTLSGSQIQKFKVDRESLALIPYGYKSQFAENIIDFELKPESKDTFRLKIISEKGGGKLSLDSLIRVGVEIIKKE